MPEWLSSFLARLGIDSRQELTRLVVILVLVFATWGFVQIASFAIGGDSHAFDERILLSMRADGDPEDPIGPSWFEEIMRDVTALGGNTILLLLTFFVAGTLFLSRRPAAAWSMLVAIGIGHALSLWLKTAFDRPRPDLVPHATEVYTHSFPSGHSMLSALTYLTLAALLARQARSRRLKAYFIGAAILVTFLVGTSRVYLGVHWPTDVLGGWTAGAFWALFCWLVVQALQQRGQVEQDDKPLDSE